MKKSCVAASDGAPVKCETRVGSAAGSGGKVVVEPGAVFIGSVLGGGKSEMDFVAGGSVTAATLPAKDHIIVHAGSDSEAPSVTVIMYIITLNLRKPFSDDVHEVAGPPAARHPGGAAP